jgi:hypothetical protein
MTSNNTPFDEQLIQKKQANHTIEYQRFLKQEINETQETYYFCVEGKEDFPFYSYYFDREYRTKNRKKVIGRSKQGVLNLLAVFEEEPSLYNFYKGGILFFVDKDLDPNLTHERLFMTCGYSFENYLCDLSTVYDVLQLYHLDPMPTRQDVQKKYKAQLDQFCNEYFPIMVFVKENPSQAWVDKYKPEICFNEDWQRKSNAKSDLKKINEVDLDIEAYSTNDIRGKYVLTFLTWFIKGYLTGSEKNNKELIKERFFQKVQPIQALDDYFRRHIKEAS